ncbi:MAG: glycosyltransferase, partial [Candidatus Aerophobetes bacterium]|nr:glycosyltransferase [Candidatus Aerophobetes bacterium]
EGGESSKNYWLAKALGSRDHEVHVVTNAWEVESDYREHFEVGDLDYYQPSNVVVHNTNPFDDPWYIPYTRPDIAKLASYAIEVVRRYNLQLIDSRYVLPYAIAGFLAKAVTGRPQILHHAGSDISRLFASSYLNTIFSEIFRRVDQIVTHPSIKQGFLNLDIPEDKIFLDIKVSVDTNSFNPGAKPANLSKYTSRSIKGLPVITYIGKVGATKGIFELVEALGQIREDFVLLFVSQGRGIGRLKDTVAKNNLTEKTVFLSFVPPWRIPSIIKASTCVVHPERDFPVLGHQPILPREVLAVGTCLMLSKELYEKYAWSGLREGKHCLVVNPKDIRKFRRKLKKIIKNPGFARKMGQEGHKLSEKIEDFEGYVGEVEKLYRKVLGKK